MKNRIYSRIAQFGASGLTIALTVSMCITVVFYLFLSHLNLVGSALSSAFDVIYPVFLGIVLAYIMDPLCKLLETRVFKKINKEGQRRSLSVAVALLLLIALIAILLGALIPQIVSSIGGFFGNLNSYARSFSGLLGQIADMAAEKNIDLTGVEEKINEFLESLTSILSSSLGRIAQTSLNFGSNVMNFFIGFILAIYLLMDKSRVLNSFDRLLRVLLSGRTHDVVTDFLKRCNDTLITYIVIDLLDALMVGVVNFIFMVIAGIPYAVMISVIVGVFNLAPTFGPIAGCLLGALLLLLVNPWYALFFIIFTIILQIFDGYIFKPKIFGNRFGVSAIWILIFLVVGGRLFGVSGILLAIPLASIVDYLYHDVFMDKMEKRRLAADRREKNEAVVEETVRDENRVEIPIADGVLNEIKNE